MSPVPGAEPEAVADARRWGLAPDEIAAIGQALTGIRGAGVRVWPQNIETVLAFLVGATQWRTALQPVEAGLQLRWVGLDYASVKVSIEESDLKVTPTIWGGLRQMEIAARDALNGVD